MDNRDLALKISLSTVKEHLMCPICMGPLEDTRMTHCGHRFCRQCISECVNRKPICPCCNAHLTGEMVIKDPLFDNLIQAVKAEETEAEKTYFDDMINSATENATSTRGGDYQELRKLFSPVEEVLKEHLKRSLSLHEKFYQDLQRDLRRRHSDINVELKRSVEKLRETRSNSITETEIEKLTKDAEKQKNDYTAEIHRCSALVAEAYDKYLNEHIPPLSVLPVTVTISLLNKSLQFSGISLKPQDSIADIRNMITELMKKKLGENVIGFGDDVRFLSFSPFARRSLYEMFRISTDIIDHGATSPDILVLPADCRPVLQFGIKPGSEIAVYGVIRCESDLPKVCFASTFQATENKPMDYFKCKGCKLNWICRPCIDTCHKDHDVVLYIEKHQPTWACCYCGRKKKCAIQT